MAIQVATENKMLRILAMDEQGYSHKPLERVDIMNETVLDILEHWDMFDWTDKREDISAAKYACWMTDEEDLHVDKHGHVGTSCVLVRWKGHTQPEYEVMRHSQNGCWMPAFRDVRDTFDEVSDPLVDYDLEKWEPYETMSGFDTFAEAWWAAKDVCAWESNNRKALAEYRSQPRSSERWSKDKKKAYLIEATDGRFCWGCGREFDSAEYLHLDHIRPRADGGSDSVSNLALLCPPCNGTAKKGKKLTLTGLRDKNKKDKFMVREIPIPSIPIIHE